MVSVTMKELLEAGVHFGHQTKRWNPKMKEYIFGQRNGIYIVDLQKTIKNFKEALNYLRSVAEDGKMILFVGHEETGPGHRPRLRHEVRVGLRQPALAGRPADELRRRPDERR